MAQWLLEEVTPLDAAAERQLARSLAAPAVPGKTRGDGETPHLAVRLQEITIYDNKKWFGEADIRVDALVVHGNAQKGQPHSLYAPGTFRFGRIRDGDTLPTGDNGLLAFYGKPRYFLDLFLMVSRDKKDTDDLATLLNKGLNEKETQAALGTLLGLAIAAPQVAAVTAALGAAATLGNFAYQALSQATGSTIGLYRTNFLQARDRFGIGRHPAAPDSYRVNDLSFCLDIVPDVAQP